MVLLLLAIVGAPIAYVLSSDKSVARQAGRAAGPRKTTSSGNSKIEIPEEERYRLQKIAGRSIPVTMVASLIAPLGYLLVKKPWWALISALTLNFGVIGTLFVMFHTRKTIKDARRELAAAGINW
ncbi:hypothetical protein [Halorussus litoreus]|uniref:hypothetical protein n=1 Tax=Halorussus litoreus TaxID=1710536 RepID=UPI00130063D7|nr:hypothetical protein [Halorussus litoreus]